MTDADLKKLSAFHTQQIPSSFLESLISLDLCITQFYCFQGKGPSYCCLFYCFLSQSCEALGEVRGASPYQVFTEHHENLCPKKISNSELLMQTSEEPINGFFIRRRWTCIGHVQRCQDSNNCKIAEMDSGGKAQTQASQNNSELNNRRGTKGTSTQLGPRGLES